MRASAPGPGSSTARARFSLEHGVAAEHVGGHARVHREHRRHRGGDLLALAPQHGLVLLDAEVERRDHALARDLALAVAVLRARLLGQDAATARRQHQSGDGVVRRRNGRARSGSGGRAAVRNASWAS